LKSSTLVSNVEILVQEIVENLEAASTKLGEIAVVWAERE
jgi:hypothetical protein